MKIVISVIISVYFFINISYAQTVATDSIIFNKTDEYFTLLTNQKKFSGSLLITRDGKTIISKGYGLASYEYNIPCAPHTIFRIGSLSKQFTAFAIMQLVDKGLLSVNDAIEKYIPGYPNGKKITIHHLLTNTSVIPREKTNEENGKYLTAKETVEFEKDIADTLLFEPGTNFHYSNVGFNILAYIIEVASGKSIETYVSENIFQPLGMKHSGYYDHKTILENRAYGYTHDNANKLIASDYDAFHSKGSGGLYSTVEDLAIWEEHMPEIISENDLKKIRTAYSKNGYGYGIEVLNKHNQMNYSHTGGLSGYLCYMLRLEKDKINVIFLSNIGDIALLNIIKDVNAILFDEAYELPKEIKRVKAEINSSIYSQFTGEYRLELDKTQIAKIFIEDNRLFITDQSDDKRELFPETELIYFANPESEESVEFVIDEQKNVTSLNFIILGGAKLKASKIGVSKK